MIELDTEVVASERVIVAAHHQRMANLFHLKHAMFHDVSA